MREQSRVESDLVLIPFCHWVDGEGGEQGCFVSQDNSGLIGVLSG